MTPARKPSAADSAPPAVQVLEGAALACILAVVVARPFVGEMPFLRAQLVFARGSAAALKRPVEELIRVSFSMILLGSVSLWAVAQTLRSKLRMAGRGFAVMILVFAALAFASTLTAADRGKALEGWLGQVAMLLAALVVIQLARQRHRRRLVVVVLAAVGLSMGCKSIFQVTSEFPRHAAQFRADPYKVLEGAGIKPGSPEARSFEAAVSRTDATGYLGLANGFASLLIIPAGAAAGLAGDKLARALRSARAGKDPPRRQRYGAMLAAAVGAVSVLAVLTGLILTRSKGAVGATAMAAAAGAAIVARGSFFIRHRRKLLLACGALLLAGIVAAWAHVRLRGRLPDPSMQARWEYWTASAHIVRERPLQGVGLHNFGEAYLKHRVWAAARAPKSAHNAFVDAACAFGLPSAGVYAAMVIWVLLAMTRPAPAERPEGNQPGGGRIMVRWCIFLTVVVFAIRMASEQPANEGAALMEAVLPAAVFATALLAMMWTGRRLDEAGSTGSYARIGLGAGLAAFLVHNLISFTLLWPATGTVFWIAAAAAVAPAVSGRELPGAKILSRATAVLVIAGTVAAGVWMWLPVQRKTFLLGSAQRAYARGQVGPAIASLEKAAAADALDATAPDYLARILRSRALGGPADMRGQYAADAVRYARLAHKRWPRAESALLLARTLFLTPQRRHEALQVADSAVQLDPMYARLRWQYAKMLYQAGRPDEARRQVHRLRQLDNALPPEHPERLTERELQSLTELEQNIEAARAQRAGRGRPASS